MAFYQNNTLDKAKDNPGIQKEAHGGSGEAVAFTRHQFVTHYTTTLGLII